MTRSGTKARMTAMQLAVGNFKEAGGVLSGEICRVGVVVCHPRQDLSIVASPNENDRMQRHQAGNAATSNRITDRTRSAGIPDSV